MPKCKSYSKADVDMIRDLKATYASGPTGYIIRILGRGEMAFYREGDRAMLVEVIAGYGVIAAGSIREWDTGESVSQSERAVVVDRFSELFIEMGTSEVKVVN